MHLTVASLPMKDCKDSRLSKKRSHVLVRNDIFSIEDAIPEFLLEVTHRVFIDAVIVNLLEQLGKGHSIVPDSLFTPLRPTAAGTSGARQLVNATPP